MVHPLHTFCFAELYTPDIARARKFYGDLFGWTTIDRSGGYSIFQKDGQDVAGLRRSDSGDALWVNYVAVASVDDAKRRVEALGGKTLMPPFDTPGVARTAVVASTEGATFGLWEERGISGSAIQDKTGSMWWVELWTPDRVVGRPFYTELFGWTFAETLKYDTNGPYTVFKAGDVTVGGASQTRPEWGVKPSWQVFFAIDDYDSLVRQACALGGEEIFNREVPDTGRLSIMFDPSGALFMVMHPKVIAT